MSDKPDALEFAQLEANVWRMKYLKVQQELREAVATEREACAKVCEERMKYWQRDDIRRQEDEQCAEAIRARE